MKKIGSLAFYAMVAPIITLSSGALFAQVAPAGDADSKEQTTQNEQDAAKYPPAAAQTTQSSPRAGQLDSQATTTQRESGVKTNMPSRGYMNALPANGIQASYLIGADVSTTGGEEVGPVDDLIIGANGQVMGIIVGVGGFLGIGEKSVAIGWDDVTKSGQNDELELHIDVSRDDLRTAPEYTMAE